MEMDANVVYSVSSTTRAPRPCEKHGRDYYFFERDEFLRRVGEGEFAEWAEVHGNLYGTLKTELEGKVKSGKDVVLQLDVQGMRNLKKSFPEVVTIFLMPPSIAELERRLRNRGMNGEDDIAVRLKNAETEIGHCHAYDYSVVNDDLEKAVADVAAIIRSQRHAAAPGTLVNKTGATKRKNRKREE
jgi:guanylate kinase